MRPQDLEELYHKIRWYFQKNLGEKLSDSYNKSAKIQPILEKLVERFKLLCKLERDISIDESLLLRKGSLSLKQCIPKKRSRFGLIAFVLSEGSPGYVWSVVLYTVGQWKHWFRLPCNQGFNRGLNEDQIDIFFIIITKKTGEMSIKILGNFTNLF